MPKVPGASAHPRQREFVEGFEAGDAERMARALISIAEEFGNVLLSDTTRQDIEWSCREVVETMVEYNHSLGYTIDVPEIRAHLMLNAFLQQDVPGSGRWSRVRLQLTPPATASPDLKQRWTRLGFSAEELIVNRPSAQPARLTGVHGSERVSIHRPKGELCAPSNQTYAHALSLQARRQGPYLDRYRAGDREQVWVELVGLEEAVRQEPVLADAAAVARETMERCRSNIQCLSDRLIGMGYRFENPDQVLVPPAANAREQISALETRVGPLPLSICAWYEVVGSVDFRGSHPDWHVDYPDPLVVEPSDYILSYDEDNWYRGRYWLDIAPDPLHKENVSGGPAYALSLPNAAVDALVEHERHKTTFVNYLRTCFRWGGFPGWEESAAKTRPIDALKALSQDLLPI